jgi:hypothetical protein
MDAFLHFMMSDTTLFGFNIHNWIVALAGFIVIWGAIIVKDLGSFCGWYPARAFLCNVRSGQWTAVTK